MLLLIVQAFEGPIPLNAYFFTHGLLALLMLAVGYGVLRVSARALLLTALLCRVLLIFCAPFTTHDVDRYLWDGAVLLEGLDPYTVAPIHASSVSQVAALLQIWSTPAEHAAYPTIYPPLALLVFALCAAAGPVLAPFLWSVLAGVGSMVVVGIAYRMFSVRQFAWIALNPLLILEAGVGSHVDIFVCVGVLLFLKWHHDRPILSSGVVAVAALFKYTALPVLGPVLMAARCSYKSLLSIGLALFLFMGAFVVIRVLGYDAVGSLPVFMRKWRFGSPVFSFLVSIFGDMKALKFSTATMFLAYAVLAVMSFRGRRVHGGLLAMAVGIPLVFTPVLFPWYALPLTLFLPLLSGAMRLSVLSWLLVLPLSYEVLYLYEAEGIWRPALWPLVVMGVFPLAILLFGAYAYRLKLRAEASWPR